jgi:hypothetical protein
MLVSTGLAVRNAAASGMILRRAAGATLNADFLRPDSSHQQCRRYRRRRYVNGAGAGEAKINQATLRSPSGAHGSHRADHCSDDDDLLKQTSSPGVDILAAVARRRRTWTSIF